MNEELNKTDLPKGWKWVKVGEYAISVKGKKPKRISKEKTKECSLPYVNIKAFEKNIIDEYTDGVGCALCEEGDFLMVWDGSRSGYVGKAIKGALGSTLVKLNFPDIENNYAYYFLQSKYIEINTRAKGVGIPHVDPNILWNYKLLIPPKPIQQAIISKIEELLSELDKGIENLVKAQEQLKIYRLAVLKCAFEGKLTNSINNDSYVIYDEQNLSVAAEPKSDYKIKKTLDNWANSANQDSNDNKLPNGWKWQKLNEIGEWKGGGTPSKANKAFWQDGTVLWVSPKDMKSKIIHNTIDKITVDAIKYSSTKLISKSSILFVVRSGILRRTLPIAITICDVTVNQDIQAFTPKGILTEYVYWYVQSKNEDIRRYCSKDGTTVESIESSLLKNYSIPICSKNEQHLIVQAIENRFSVSDKLEETITQSLLQSEALRQSILKKAFGGKLVLIKSESQGIVQFDERKAIGKITKKIFKGNIL